MRDKLKQQYREIVKDHFPRFIEISFYDESHKRQTLLYEKTTWTIDGETRGLRYGENPQQEAALYRLTNGNLVLGAIEFIKPNEYLCSWPELLRSGKHPGKINLTDIDSALAILKYLMEEPCTVIVKHNNPSGVAQRKSLAESFWQAYLADRIAAFGGAVAFNRALDRETAQLLMTEYFEVVAAPEFEDGVIDILSTRKNLRVIKIKNIERLKDFAFKRFVDFKSLQDGGLILQVSFKPEAVTPERLVPASSIYQGKEYRIKRLPSTREYEDLIFGWIVEAGVTSNSVLYVKDKVTVGIGTGEQDRVGVAEIARDKAYKKYTERKAWEHFNKSYAQLNPSEKELVELEVQKDHGGLCQAVMVSDAFFPFRDGVDVGIREGITAIIQPGGSQRDYEVIEACNEANVAMVFTQERSFRH